MLFPCLALLSLSSSALGFWPLSAKDWSDPDAASEIEHMSQEQLRDAHRSGDVTMAGAIQAYMAKDQYDLGFKTSHYDPKVGRIVAVGDLHGDWVATVQVLTMAKIIDKHQNWIAGTDVLVQTGDIADRGNSTMKIFRLFRKLERQAKKSGGQVIQLLGNHEVMNLQGDLRYVSARDIKLFGGKKKREKAFSREGWLGKVLYNLPIAANVNGTVFFHAGANMGWAKYGVEGLNKKAKEELELSGYRSFYDRSSVLGSTGPLWYRGYAANDVFDVCTELSAALEYLKAKRMVIGHTISPSGFIRSRCKSKLFIIDVGMSRAYRKESYAAAIEIVNDHVHSLYQNATYNGEFDR